MEAPSYLHIGLLIILAIYAIGSFLVYILALKVNRDGIKWLIISIIFNPILVIILLGYLTLANKFRLEEKKNTQYNESKLDISDEMIAERRGGSGKMPDDMPLWMAKTIINIDKFSKWIGNIVCWILMPLIFAMTYEVLARKLFLAPTIWAYDISRFLYGALFMLGAGYALSRGVHIRADFLYRNFKTKNQGLIDFWLYLLFYFPGLIVFLYMTIGYVGESIQRGERGMDTTWMPYMWPIKTCLLIGIVFLLVQGVSELLKSYWAAKKGEWPGEKK